MTTISHSPSFLTPCPGHHEMWQTHGDEVGRSKDDLSSWLREKFFKDVHRQMYDNAPIDFPLSSSSKNFVAHINIHRRGAHTLRALLAQHLLPEQRALETLRDNLRTTLDTADGRDRSQADRRLDDTLKLLDEFAEFIDLVHQCAEFGPPPTDSKCPPPRSRRPLRPRARRWHHDQRLRPLAPARPPVELPQKVVEAPRHRKRLPRQTLRLVQTRRPLLPHPRGCEVPGRPVSGRRHGVFWKYHPARAYESELRLQDEIGPEFEIEEDGAGEAREKFLRECAGEVERIREEEHSRRQRNVEKKEETLLLG
ncbi:hypothetical protein DV096_15455 [Bradymonadaceae bacterium TMQ3]|nr:hypothetical protein DV096_15455 [Bradymonadaceae bacterium TMQ3]TXC73033.1 hypothetical protein FRC91_16400 [Bradymonadales bacterium TMQ1]